MPRAKSLSHYPKEYTETIGQCSLGAKKSVAFDTFKEAKSIQGHYYAFLGVIKAEGRRLANLPSRSRGEDETLQRALQAQTIMVQIIQEEEKFWVIWQNRENSWQAKAMARAIVESPKPMAAEGELAETANRLMQIQQEADNER